MAPSHIALRSDRRRTAFSILFCLLSLASLYFLFFPEKNDICYSLAVIYIYIMMIFFPMVASITVKYLRPTVILFIVYYLSTQYTPSLSPFILVPLTLTNALLVARNLSEPAAERRNLNYVGIYIAAAITVVALFLIIRQLARA